LAPTLIKRIQHGIVLKGEEGRWASETGRLSLGELTPRQTPAAYHVGEIYAASSGRASGCAAGSVSTVCSAAGVARSKALRATAIVAVIGKADCPPQYTCQVRRSGRHCGADQAHAGDALRRRCRALFARPVPEHLTHERLRRMAYLANQLDRALVEVDHWPLGVGRFGMEVEHAENQDRVFVFVILTRRTGPTRCRP
jgi:hypothetical protein